MDNTDKRKHAKEYTEFFLDFLQDQVDLNQGLVYYKGFLVVVTKIVNDVLFHYQSYIDLKIKDEIKKEGELEI